MEDIKSLKVEIKSLKSIIELREKNHMVSGRYLFQQLKSLCREQKNPLLLYRNLHYCKLNLLSVLKQVSQNNREAIKFDKWILNRNSLEKAVLKRLTILKKQKDGKLLDKMINDLSFVVFQIRAEIGSIILNLKKEIDIKSDAVLFRDKNIISIRSNSGYWSFRVLKDIEEIEKCEKNDSIMKIGFKNNLNSLAKELERKIRINSSELKVDSAVPALGKVQKGRAFNQNW